jgi:endogenous inhibitor of DNA gyrase (YacG/DUF329 family)
MKASDACPYCRRRPAAAPWQPFCSERCKMADLGRWLGGEYRVPGEDVPPDAGAADDPSPTDRWPTH